MVIFGFKHIKNQLKVEEKYLLFKFNQTFTKH